MKGALLLRPHDQLERRAKKWNPVFRKTGATTIESTASGDRDLSPDAVERVPEKRVLRQAQDEAGFRIERATK
jgi:hypothetical protein